MDLENAYEKIYRYVYFRIKNQTLAEDITQETFLRFISQKGNIHNFEMKYLYTIARNLCIDEYRKVKLEPLPEDYKETVGNVDELFEERLVVRQVLAGLPLMDQELLLLRHVNGESVGTISNALGISRFTLYRRLKSAEESFRTSLEGINHEK